MGNILKIRDENGKFIDIDAIRGANGKSAYEQAKEGGYVGTEAEFKKAMVDLTTVIGHTTNKSNPHGVTKSQVGLGNVNNTSDANKPVSTAQAAAIADAKKAGTDAQSSLNSHTSNKSNPHEVTASQIGAANAPLIVRKKLHISSDNIDGHYWGLANEIDDWYSWSHAATTTIKDATNIANAPMLLTLDEFELDNMFPLSDNKVLEARKEFYSYNWCIRTESYVGDLFSLSICAIGPKSSPPEVTLPIVITIFR